MDTTTYIFYTLTLSNRNVPALRVPGMDDRHHSGVEIRWRHGDDVSPRHPARAWQLCDVVLHSFAGVKDAR